MSPLRSTMLCVAVCCCASPAAAVSWDFSSGPSGPLPSGWTSGDNVPPGLTSVVVRIAWGIVSDPGGGYAFGPIIPPGFVQGLNGQQPPYPQFDTYADSPLFRFTNLTNPSISFDLAALYPDDGDSHASDGLLVSLWHVFGGGTEPVNTQPNLPAFQASSNQPSLPETSYTVSISDSINPNDLYELRFAVHDWDVNISLPVMLMHHLTVTGASAVLPGDANFDGLVNGLDVASISSHWLQAGTAVAGDVNLDGVVNGLDIALVASHWLTASGGGAGGGTTAVPEPATIALVALGGLALIVCPRRFVWTHSGKKPAGRYRAG